MKNTPKYALAIFDMDGTILNTIDDLADSLNVILERYSMPLHTVDQVRFMVGNGIPKLIERAIPNGRDNSKFDEILKEYIAYYEEHSAIKTRPYDGIVEAVKALRKSGVKIAVNTNKVEAAALDLVAKYFPDTALAITDSIVCDQHLLSDKIFGKDYNYESVGKFVSEFGDEGWAELDADPQEIADKNNAEQETKDGISQRKEEEEEYYRSRGI